MATMSTDSGPRRSVYRRLWGVAVTYACVVAMAGLAIAVTPLHQTPVTPLDDDEKVVLFPTYGHFDPSSSTWIVNIHGWVFEPEEDSMVRGASLRAFRRYLGLADSTAMSGIFEERARAFLVDNERGERVSIRLAGDVHTCRPTGPNGHFGGTVHIPAGNVGQSLGGRQAGWLPCEVVLPSDDPRHIAGAVQLIGKAGLSVISDIDDTIKVTNVADRQALLANTFLRDFEAVPGMAALYGAWAAKGVRFHYVSASPWQLYQPLSAWMKAERFPAGSFHLKHFRIKDHTALDLIASPEQQKLDTIESIVTTFPGRQFILVGDSGEKDPEIYGTIARKFPQQVIRILIRNVTSEDPAGERFARAFQGIPPERLLVFRDAPLKVRLPF